MPSRQRKIFQASMPRGGRESAETKVVLVELEEAGAGEDDSELSAIRLLIGRK